MLTHHHSDLLTRVEYRCQTLTDGRQVAELVAQLCPRPSAQLPGLMALIANAIEHGNLGIGAKLKAELLQSGRWLDEVERRLKLPEYAARRVTVTCIRTAYDVVIQIADEGQGFDFASCLRTQHSDSVRHSDHGIALAQRGSFDTVEYRGTGSEVFVRVLRSAADNPSANELNGHLHTREIASEPGKAPRTKPLVIVADDEPVTQTLLLGTLRATYDVVLAVDGRDALEKYEALAPDLMLVDVHMPVMGGAEVCERVRAHEREAHTPILLMSSQDDEPFVLDALAKGADDFVVKPFSPRVLRSKIHAQLSGKNMRDALARQHARLLALQRETTHEHFVAHAVLRNIVGRAELEHPSIRYVMSGMTGFEGDVALVAKLPSGGLRVMVCDVTGHGLPAAFGTIPVSLLFYSTTRRGLDLSDTMSHINRELCGVLPVGLFAAAATFEVSADGRKMQVWNGGLPDLLLRRGGSQELQRFASRNLPIGLTAHEAPAIDEVDVQQGDVMFAMTDGVLETRDQSGQLFGIERVVSTLSERRPTVDLFDDLRRALSAFGLGRQDDDITLLAYTVGARPDEEAGA